MDASLPHSIKGPGYGVTAAVYKDATLSKVPSQKVLLQPVTSEDKKTTPQERKETKPEMNFYTGGIPPLNSRRQRGAGFLSTLKRFLVPIAKTVLPQVVGAVGDVLGGKSALDTLKSRGRAAGAGAMHSVADTLSPNAPPPKRKYKRNAASPQKRIRKKTKQTSWS